jgi:beta-lactamase class A
MQDVHDGRYALDDTIAVSDEFTSLVDGRPFKVEANAAAVKAAVGGTMKVRELVEHMITVSDNLATNVLIRQAGEAAAINACAQRYGVTKCNVLRYIQDIAAFEAGYSSQSQARDFGELMERLWRGEVISRAASDEMLAVMSRLKGRSFIPAGLPEGTRVAHKTGAITAVRNDVGLVYRAGRAPVVMVFLSGELKSDKGGEKAIADAARIIYDGSRE